MSLRAAVRRLAHVAVVAALIPAVQALAVTTPAAGGFHCVNGKGIQVRGAYTQQDCKAPYRWVQTGKTAAKKATVASATTPKKHRKGLALATPHRKGHHKKAHHTAN